MISRKFTSGSHIISININMAFHGEHRRIAKSNKIDAPCKDSKATSLIDPPYITADMFPCLEDSDHPSYKIQSIHKSFICVDFDDEMAQ